MAVTYNLHCGLAAWATSHSYVIGNRVKASSNCYQCIANGTSLSTGTGPTGTGTNISDNTVSWKYLSTVDYSGNTADVMFTAAQSGLPSTFTQNVTWQIWNDGVLQTAASGTWFLFLQNHVIPPFSLLITAAPGDSFRDWLNFSNSPITTANSKYGVTFQYPATGQGGVNYFEIHDDNVIFDGLQFLDPQPYDQSTMWFTYANNTTLQYCIFDGYGQNNGATMLGFQGKNDLLKNVLILDRQLSNYFTAASPGTTIGCGGGSANLINCGVISTVGQGNTALAVLNNGGIYTSNGCYFFGFNEPSFINSGNVTWHNVATDSNAAQNMTTTATNVFYSTNRSNCFINYPNDLHVSAHSPLRANAVSQSWDFPSVDLIRNERANTKPWDIGPIQFQYQEANPQIIRLRAP